MSSVDGFIGLFDLLCYHIPFGAIIGACLAFYIAFNRHTKGDLTMIGAYLVIIGGTIIGSTFPWVAFVLLNIRIIASLI